MAHCIVIGAGIAGACTAYSLAKRGWQVTVLDHAAKPASGASGLPVGLFAPYLSADNNFTSQITQVGVKFTQKLASQLLRKGIDWQPSGVMTRKFDKPDLWQANAGWIKPAALVKACLSQPNVYWQGNSEVIQICTTKEGWQVIGANKQVIAEADMTVVTASNQSADMLHDVVPTLKLNLQAIRGQVTFGNLTDLDPKLRTSFPYNGNGSYIETNDAWLVAASYDRTNSSLRPQVTDQAENFERLESLVPDIASQLKPRFARSEVQNWVGIRCATADRLPIVSEISKGLWICTAMASRGLTFAPLCAELLAALRHEEVLPLNSRLVKALSVQRYTP